MDTFKGGGKPEVLETPSVSPFEKEVGEGSGVHDPEEDFVSFFLGFFREFRQDSGELFENLVIKGRISLR